MEIKKLPKNKFPKALLEIHQPPENLWIIGDLPTDENLIYLYIVKGYKFSNGMCKFKLLLPLDSKKLLMLKYFQQIFYLIINFLNYFKKSY